MSVDIHWDTLTGGADGTALAETIRAFVHDRFQQVTLPRFIRSVKVHHFDFGSVAPEIEIKDICDPLLDFYEEDDDPSSDDDVGPAAVGLATTLPSTRTLAESSGRHAHPLHRRETHHHHHTSHESLPSLRIQRPLPNIDTRLPGLRATLAPVEQVGSPLLSRAPTPVIPGGTSNLTYFHLPLGGLSGTATPLAAVAGAHFQGGWSDQNGHKRSLSEERESHLRKNSIGETTPPSTADPASRPPSQHQH